MRDHSIPGQEPRNWSQAFSALPLESPGDRPWPAIAASVVTSQKGQHRPLRWMAAAAVLALAIAVPLAWLQTDSTVDVPAMASGKPQADAAVTSSSKATEGSANTDAAPTPGGAEAAQVSVPASTTDGSKQAAVRGDDSKPAVAAATTISPSPASPASVAQEPQAEALPALYAQSAQLEAVLAQVQDGRVASGPAAAVAAEYESSLALIDAALADPALPDAQRPVLWSERVNSLRQLVDFESSQRWLTARGERYDGQLVAVD